MFVTLRWLAVPQICKFAGSRSHHFLTDNYRYVKSVSRAIPEVVPIKASRLTGINWSLTPWRGISCSEYFESVNADWKNSVKRNFKQTRSRSPVINAASIIESVFEKNVLADALPGKLSAQQSNVKDVQRYPTSNRRRLFLSESGEYQSSTLEILKVQEMKYDKDDKEKLEGLIKDASSRKISSYSSSEIMDILRSLSRAPESKISSDFFSVSLLELCDYACQHSSECTDEEFCNFLLALYKMHASLPREQLVILEQECERRLPSWDVNTMLLVSDWWISIRQKPLTFHKSVLTSLCTEVESFTLQNVVQVFYLIGEWQHVPSEDFLQKLTDLVELHLDSLSWNEIGVICNAFIKSRSRILSRPLQRAISSRVSQDLHSNVLDHYNLISIMRFLSRAYFHDWRLFEDIAHSLAPQIPDMAFLVPPHIAAAFAKVRHFNQDLMDAVASRALQSADYIRFKDIWMLLWAYCRLNYHPPNSKDFFQGLIHQMAGKPEQLAQPYIFIKSLVSLTFIENYPTPLINKAFSPECLRQCQDKCPQDIYKLLYVLDSSVAIEHPEYHGNRLPQAFIDKFWQSPHGSTKNIYKKIHGLEEVMHGLQCILGGAEYVKAHPILPHIRTPLDVEVHLDSSSKPLSLESEQSLSSEELRISSGTESGKDNRQRLAILVSPRAHYRLRSRDLLGVHVMKRRQLKKVGYKIVEIPFYEWDHLTRTSQSEQQDYLKAKIFP